MQIQNIFLNFFFFDDLLPQLCLISRIIFPLIRTNPWVYFDWLFPEKLNHIGSMFIDVAGEGEGIGVFIEPDHCFQIHRNIYSPFLLEYFSNASDPLHILYQELLAYLLGLWFIIFKLKRSNVHYHIVLNNQTVFYILRKSVAKTCPAANKLMFIFCNLVYKHRICQHFEWTSTHQT